MSEPAAGGAAARGGPAIDFAVPAAAKLSLELPAESAAPRASAPPLGRSAPYGTTRLLSPPPGPDREVTAPWSLPEQPAVARARRARAAGAVIRRMALGRDERAPGSRHPPPPSPPEHHTGSGLLRLSRPCPRWFAARIPHRIRP